MMDEERSRALSKGMAGLLRHANAPGFTLDAEGFAGVEAVVAAINATSRPTGLGVSFDAGMLAEVVGGDPKGRFELSGDGRRVRAVSGHSVAVDLSLRPYAPGGPLWFGTVVDMVDRIVAEGMTGSAKLKVRLSDSLDAAMEVAIARGCGGPAVFEVDAQRLARDGWTFGLAANGEILVDRFGPGYATPCVMAPVPGR